MRNYVTAAIYKCSSTPSLPGWGVPPAVLRCCDGFGIWYVLDFNVQEYQMHSHTNHHSGCALCTRGEGQYNARPGKLCFSLTCCIIQAQWQTRLKRDGGQGNTMWRGRRVICPGRNIYMLMEGGCLLGASDALFINTVRAGVSDAGGGIPLSPSSTNNAPHFQRSAAGE